jgi:hypothetical protein
VTISTALERVAIAVVSLLVSIGLIAVLSGFFASHDPASVSGAPSEVGQQFRDLGHAQLRPGQPPPHYDSDPPTSGPHLPAVILRDQTELSTDQLLEALQSGDVVIMYGTHTPPPGLTNLARSVAGPFRPALAAAGQSVVLARRPGTTGLIGLAWAHMVHVSSPSDLLLRAFADYWLGRGAPAT